jgi:hypothetical protein
VSHLHGTLKTKQASGATILLGDIVIGVLHRQCLSQVNKNYTRYELGQDTQFSLPTKSQKHEFARPLLYAPQKRLQFLVNAISRKKQLNKSSRAQVSSSSNSSV